MYTPKKQKALRELAEILKCTIREQATVGMVLDEINAHKSHQLIVHCRRKNLRHWIVRSTLLDPKYDVGALPVL
ncbi:MAG: hypothetical protein ACKPKO_42415, partial [Candidatus Fonsibacter sp.]